MGPTNNTGQDVLLRAAMEEDLGKFLVVLGMESVPSLLVSINVTDLNMLISLTEYEFGELAKEIHLSFGHKMQLKKAFAVKKKTLQAEG